MEVCCSNTLDMHSLCCIVPVRQQEKQPPIDATERRPWYLQRCVKRLADVHKPALELSAQ